jgi:hypothetical protein
MTARPSRCSLLLAWLPPPLAVIAVPVGLTMVGIWEIFFAWS